jgi:hypothetical protein
MEIELKKLSDEVLIKETKKAVGEEREVVARVLCYLCEVQRRRLFALYGYPSLFKFCIKYLGYTEGQTQRRLEAMRAMAVIPEIEEKIKVGSLSLTAVAQAQSYFKSKEKENKSISVEAKKEVFLSLENKSTRECELELIKLTGEKPYPREKTKLISQSHTQATLNFPNEVIEKLERIKSLLSNKNPNMSQSELIHEMAEIVLDKIDPIRKEQRKFNSKLRRNVSLARIVTHKKMTPKKEVSIRDQVKCSYISPITRQKCDSTFQLEMDHIHPKALGGETSPENLRLLCKAHNQRAAIEAFGLKKMNSYLNHRRDKSKP